MKNIAIMASGSGTNAENIIRFFRTKSDIEVKVVLTNRSDAYVIKRAGKLHVETVIFNREELYESEEIHDLLKKRRIDLIVLAGFLWLIPKSLIDIYKNRIINIHPALLPKYGGKGMYGNRVHEAVLQSKDKESGITIHFVNEKYDAGDIIFQAKCGIDPAETPESLAEKIHKLEYKYYPEVIERLLEGFK
ncbi:MAG TPA: phosphoribosylglycinamide formyltransferase [Bacteroidaceae bacterium]|nr:phosphoribosylglycinamide formyltransferase [Bacteroidaceae bacterium]